MEIAGVHKVSLVDYPGGPCMSIFCPKCSFRCPYCHNANIAFVLNMQKENLVDIDTIYEYLDKKANLLDAVCITGGEPTLQKDLYDFIKDLRKRYNIKIKLDTNGSNPEILENLCNNNMVDYVAMDVKNSIEYYSDAVGIKGFDTTRVEKSIDYLISSDVNYEFRTTVAYPIVDKTTLSSLAKRIKDAKLWRLQEFVDSEFVPNKELKNIKQSDLVQIINNIEIKPAKIIIYN